MVVPDDICLSHCVGATSGRPCRSPVKPCISTTARLHNLVQIQALKLPEAGRRGRRPLHYGRKFYRRKIAPLFADFTLCRRIEKRCRLTLRYNHVSGNNIAILLFSSAPLSRLAPIEALPQAPLGTLSLDPAMGFTP